MDTTVDAADAIVGDGLCATSALPPSTCSLRAAVQESNVHFGADSVVLPAGTYILTVVGSAEDLAATGDLDILDDLVIIGAGEDLTVIDGGALDRVFDVGPGASPVTVQLRDLSVTNGLVEGSSGNEGGCVRVGPQAALDLTRVTVSSCTCQFSGCGAAVAGQVTGRDVSFLENASTDVPGSAVGGGIAVVGNAASVSLTRCLLDGNHAGNGGAVYTSAEPGAMGQDRAHLELDRCSLVNNQALQIGGAIHADQATDIVITSSTMSGNVGGMGGALGNDGGCTFDIRGSTIVGNHATSIGGGVFEVHFQPDFIGLSNTILAGNTADFLGPDCNFKMHSNGGVLIGDPTDCVMTPGPGDLSATDAVLSGLVARGLRVRVHIPQAGSPVIDAGHDPACGAVDQLGGPRPRDGNGDGVAVCDVGAIELPLPLFADGFEYGTPSAWSSVAPGLP